MVAGEYPKGIKRQKREAYNSLRPRAEVKNPTATCILSYSTSRTGMAPTTSYPMVAGERPKGIKRPKRGADKILRPRAEVKNASATCILSSSTSRPGMTPTTSYPMVAWERPKGIKRPKRGADKILRPRAEVKNATATCILSSTTSRQAMAPTELPIQWLQGNFPMGKSGQTVGLSIYYDLGLSSKS
jgi:hypothetical protein